jgi:hypothetical protein
MAHRQQVRRHSSGQCLFRHRRRTGHQQNLLGLIAGVVHQRHLQSREPQAGAAGNNDYGLQPVLGLVAASCRPNAFIDSQRDRRIIARHRQGRGMDVGRQLELVVDHRVAPAVGLQSQVPRVFRHRQRHSLFQLARVHRVTELQRGDQLFEIRVPRVLVELALRNLRGKGLAPEVKAEVFQQNSPGEEALPRERNGKRLVNGPVVLRREFEVLVAHPAPGAGHLRGKVDPGRDRLFHLLQRRRGLAEFQGQRFDGRDPLVAVLGKPRCSDGERDVVWNRAAQIPDPAANHATCHHEHESRAFCVCRNVAPGLRKPATDPHQP